MRPRSPGRNRVHLYHAEDEVVAERHGQLRWVREVNLALKRRSPFALPYYPARPAPPEPHARLI